MPRPRVLDIYPYAVYKVLAYLGERGALGRLGQEEEVEPLLDDDFLSYFPIPYKHNGSPRGTRAQGMRDLYRVLTHPEVGLEFRSGLPAPDSGTYSHKRMTDIYDAALGAVLGCPLLRKSPWGVVKGNREEGDIALLADPWLSARLDRHLAGSAARRVAA